MSFSIATRDEVWLHGHLVERRLSHGHAVEDDRGIHASDARDDALVAACDAAMDELHAFVVSDARLHLVAEASVDGSSGSSGSSVPRSSATSTHSRGTPRNSEEPEELCVTQTIVVMVGDRSVVTTPEHFAHDFALLRDAGIGDAQLRRLPFVWKHGTAAVLLHEMVGHPLEHEQSPVELPSWLRVDVPLKLRRASFKDVPLLRMTDVIARQMDAPFAMPEERVEIVLVDGGAYDPLTEEVTLRIAAANLIEGDRTRAMAPFTFRETRVSLARSIAGAAGDPLRYPGVICSREGQELVVGSYAPVLLTEPR